LWERCTYFINGNNVERWKWRFESDGIERQNKDKREEQPEHALLERGNLMIDREWYIIIKFNLLYLLFVMLSYLQFECANRGANSG
jgi:hypothetical protein